MTHATRTARSDGLAATDLAQLLDLVRVCWPDDGFSADDLDHAMGGVHWLAEQDGRIVGHASVVERAIHVAGRPMRTGYVEAVAVHPAWRHRGIATELMAQAGDHIRAHFELGVLSTGVHDLYVRAGWERWRGPAFIRPASGGPDARTEDEDDGIMILRTSATPADLDLAAPIACEERPGDSW